MNQMDKEIAQYLLQSKAIKLEPTTPFTWASGWKSPIYCDNRKTLSFPKIRNFIRDAFIKTIQTNFDNVDCIAGVATGAIAQAALVADKMELPLIYVRSKSKGHGLANQIEGHYEKGSRVVVIEDLVSTGMSSLNAVKALREAGCQVLGMTSIFTYGFPVAEENFKHEECRLYPLSNYEALLDLALNSEYIKKEELELLKNWRKDPENWKK
jgi:orotate phosphoribosyltransferase